MKTKTELLPHQYKCVEKLRKIKVGALYMEQGTGKTRVALELANIRIEQGKVDCVLWLHPCSISKDLKKNISYHCEGYAEKIVLRGIESLSSSDKLYLQLLKLVETHDVFIVIDESNLVKNFNAIRTARIIELAERCRYKLILNGTPVSKNEADLFAQWYILDWRILGYKSWYAFAANHVEYHTVKMPDGRKIIDYNRIERILNVDYLTEKIAPYTYQVKKSECMELPKKIYYTRTFYLSHEQNEIYKQVKWDYLENVDEFKSETIYKLFTALQHVASGRMVLSKPTEPMQIKPIFDSVFENPRIETLRKITEELQDVKAIIFCKYKSEISEIKTLLNTMGKSYTEFTGDIRSQQRQENIERFRGPVQFLLANKACGAYGLNLQFCNNIIYYSNDFDLATRSQSEDRVHRFGQIKDVKIYDIYAENTIDEFIINCLNRKENLVQRFKNEIHKWKDAAVMEKIKYLELSSGKNEDFYQKLGPFFASRSIRKEFDGYPLSNDDDWTWFVAEKNKKIVGFIAAEPLKGSQRKLSAVYVEESLRKQGIFKRLMSGVLKWADSQGFELVITTRDWISTYLGKVGFVATGNKGKNWIILRRGKCNG